MSDVLKGFLHEEKSPLSYRVAGDKVPDKDGEVPKLVKEGNHLEETAAVKGLSLKNMILQKRSIKEDIKENRQKRKLSKKMGGQSSDLTNLL